MSNSLSQIKSLFKVPLTECSSETDVDGSSPLSTEEENPSIEATCFRKMYTSIPCCNDVTFAKHRERCREARERKEERVPVGYRTQLSLGSTRGNGRSSRKCRLTTNESE